MGLAGIFYPDLNYHFHDNPGFGDDYTLKVNLTFCNWMRLHFCIKFSMFPLHQFFKFLLKIEKF